MKKYFIVADVHGFYDELQRALVEAGFDIDNEEHIFVSLGDLLDRGRQPLACLKFVNGLPDERKILIRGNHEDLMEEMIARQEPWSHDYSNGTYQTVVDLYMQTHPEESATSFYDAIAYIRTDPEYNKYIQSTVDYFEDGKNVFVHGWIPCKIICGWHEDSYSPLRNVSWRKAGVELWKKARWVNGMSAWNTGIKVRGKTVFCGHWHANFGNFYYHHIGSREWAADTVFTPFEDKGICAMDACTAHSGFVNCKVVEVC